MNYRIIVLLGLFVFYFQLGAQEKRNVDSLYKRLAAAKSDTLRANLLTDISTQLYRNYPDSAMALAKRVFELSSNSNYKMGKGRAFYCMGLVQQARGKFDESINYLNQAQVIFEELKRPKELSSVYNTKGLSYYGKNEIPDALSSYYESIKMSEKINDIAGQATANGNVGLIYYEQNNYDKCLEYWNLALSLDEKIGNIKGIARHTGNIANIYYRKAKNLKAEGKLPESNKNYSKAIELYTKAFEMDEKIDYKSGMAQHIGNMANLFYDLGDTAKTMEYYKKAFSIYETMNDKLGMSRQLGNLGWIYLEMKKYTEAEKNTRTAIEIVKNTKALDLLYNWYDNLSIIHETSGDYKSALGSYKTSIMLRDSLFNIDKVKKTLETQMNFEFEKKEAVAKEERARQVVIRNAFIGGFVLMFLMAIIVYRGYRNKQKANKIVSEQKELLQEKNKAITDSIHYAKRIQNAHLPSKEYITKKMDELKRKS